MIPVDIIEDEHYSFRDLMDKFQTKEEKTRIFLTKLKNYGIVKFIKKNPEEDLSDFLEKDLDDEFRDENIKYAFKYVGILLVYNFVIKCYPKYFKTFDNPHDFKQIIEVLEKYPNSRNEPISFQNDINSNFNLLSIMIYLIENYFSHGLYNNLENIIETNGHGEILWDKTINDFYPIIQNNRPFYAELFTKNTISDDNNYFKLLHEVILTKCSKDLEKANLLSIFGLAPINLSYKDLNDFGGKEYIKYMISKEFNVQFNSYKQSLLKAMYIYVDKKDSYLGDIDYFDAYGTTSYNLVWEEICRKVLGNKLTDISLSHVIDCECDEDEDLSNVIGKYKWYLDDSEIEGEPLKPDFITINKKENETQFIIFDAKYYNLDKNRKPALEDVTKQFLYELAFRKFILSHNLTPKNCFLFPTDEEDIIHKGYVEYEMFNDLNLKNIQLILLPAKKINECYLKGEKLDCHMYNKLLNIIDDIS